MYTHVQKAPLHANARIAWANHTTNDHVCTFKLSRSWILILIWIRNLVRFRKNISLKSIFVTKVQLSTKHFFATLFCMVMISFLRKVDFSWKLQLYDKISSWVKGLQSPIIYFPHNLPWTACSWFWSPSLFWSFSIGSPNWFLPLNWFMVVLQMNNKFNSKL